MTAVSILTNLFTSKEVDECLLNVQPAYNRDDIKQDTFLYLLEMADKKPDHILDLHSRDTLKKYVVKMIYNAANFSSSRVNRQLRRSTEVPTECFQCVPDDDNTDYEDRVNDVSAHVRKMLDSDKRVSDDWYYASLLVEYAEQGTYRKVEAATGIPLNSVYGAIRNAKEEIKRKICK